MATTIREEDKKYTTGYQSQYKDQIQGLYDQIAGRKDFSYDVNSDAMYQQLKDQYVQGGRMAMQDTMGQAQAMTGGYGNSYAQSVGQQAYQGYLKGLNDQVPNLYQMALNRYIQQGDQLKDQYGMLTAQEAQDYNRWATERDFDYGKYVDDRNYQYQLEERDYGRKQDQQALAIQQVQAMIDQGVRPSDEMLEQAGLSKEYLDAMLPVNAGGSGGWDPLQDAIAGYWKDRGDTADTVQDVYAMASRALREGNSISDVKWLIDNSTLNSTEKQMIMTAITAGVIAKIPQKNNQPGNGGR